MGVCQSGPELTPEEREKLKAERAGSKKLDKKIDDDMKEQEKIIKILLLGAGESGKSTLFKQMITLYGKGFSEDDRKQYISVVFENVITQAKVLCAQTELLHGVIGDCRLVDDASVAAKDFVENLKNEDIVDEEVAGHIDALWKDPKIQLVYANRAKYQLNDSVAYFFTKINQVAAKDYLPDQQDVLRTRVRTTGIVENEFAIDGNPFRMFDVGGQRNERKKWIHCFEGVTTVFFVAAISEYDQTLYEDKKTNRIEEALNLFEETCNSPFFASTPVILFLNKRDLFAEKIKSVPLTECFPDYNGGNSYEECAEFMTQAFLSRVKPSKAVYSHVTCATDSDNVRFVFEAVKDIIINRSLDNNGLR